MTHVYAEARMRAPLPERYGFRHFIRTSAYLRLGQNSTGEGTR
jgi:hypothetical protein